MDPIAKVATVRLNDGVEYTLDYREFLNFELEQMMREGEQTQSIVQLTVDIALFTMKFSGLATINPETGMVSLTEKGKQQYNK